MKSDRLSGIQKTVIFSCLIIIIGYASVSLISYFLPSYVNTVNVEGKESENYFLSFEDSSKGLNPLQWIDLEKLKGVPLTKDEKKQLSRSYVHKMLYKLMYRDIINPAATDVFLDQEMAQKDTDEAIYRALGYNYEDSMLNDIRKVTDGDEVYYIYQKEVVSQTDNKEYKVQSKMSISGKLSFYRYEEAGDQVKADAEKKERSYYELRDMVINRSFLLKTNIQYIRYICDYYGQTSTTLNELNRYVIDQESLMPYTYQVITTDTEMLLMFYGEKTLIMCFDPVRYVFTGIYFDI